MVNLKMTQNNGKNAQKQKKVITIFHKSKKAPKVIPKPSDIYIK